ncbi:MAG TPA: AI-2E family transporter [Xanthomonadales bacterium]|nr:AI-2E family transporter [Xanthomonadales bacterium]
MDTPRLTQRANFGELVETGLRLGLLGLLLLWCFRIIAPFLNLLIWGSILAIAFRPLHQRLAGILGGRNTLAATIVAVLLIAVLVVPVVALSYSVVDGVALVSESLQGGTIKLPDFNVASWPVIGEPLQRGLTWITHNAEAALVKVGPQLATIGVTAVSVAGSGGIALLVFALSAIIAAVFLVYADSMLRPLSMLADRVVGVRGGAFLVLATATIRSVFKGVIGVAVIQAALAAIGFFVLGVPGAGLWSLLVLILAIVQLPPLLILLPIAIWAFSAAETLPAVLFALWSILVGLSDNVLKVFLLGRGLAVPMLVILIGAIGGLISYGFVGLFVGPVVMALAYEIFKGWLYAGSETADVPKAASAAAASVD